MVAQSPILIIKNKCEAFFLRADNILYVEADGNYCNIRLVDGGLLQTLSYQRAEIVRMMDQQFPEEWRRQFVLLGKSYLINMSYVMHIQPSKRRLTFSVNILGTTEKRSISATSTALNSLIDITPNGALGKGL